MGLRLVEAFRAAQRAQGQVVGEVVVDPLTIAVLLLALIATAVVAGVLPARAAARVPPSEALRG